MDRDLHIPRLDTRRLILRGHRRTDLAAMAEMWADPAVVAHISGTPSTPAQTWDRMMRYAGFWHHLGFGYWAVEDRASGIFLGEVGFADFHRDADPDISGIPEAGWVMCVAAHGQGYGVEAVAAMLDWGDRNLAASKTVALFDPDHARSIALARKMGFGDDVTGRMGANTALMLKRPQGG